MIIMPQWDELNRPVGYIISVTPGFAKFGAGDERLIYMGLGRKITRAARLGFEFAEIDIEEVGEVFEPELKKIVQHIKNVQKIEIGLHLPVNMDLCIARSYAWRQMQEQLVYGAAAGAETIGAKFILFHTSSEARPDITATSGQRTPPAKLCAPNGKNLGDFIEQESAKGFNLKDWFMARHMRVLFSAMGVAGDPGMITYFDQKVVYEKKGFAESLADAKKGWRNLLRENENKIKNFMTKDYDERLKQLKGLLPATPPGTLERARIERAIDEIERAIGEIRGSDITDSYTVYRWREFIKKVLSPKEWENYNLWSEVEQYAERYNFYDVFNYWARHGSEAEEYVAYHVIAKMMYKNNDPLWKALLGSSDDPDQIIEEAIKHIGEKGTLTDVVKKLITAVAAKYIEGHLRTELEEYAMKVKIENKMQKMSVLDYCKKHRMQIFIETNMPGGYGEMTAGAPPGELRIIKATDHVKICQVIDPDMLGYCLDFEHLITNYVDPEKEAEELMKTGGGKLIKCLHTNAPRPIVGAHAPIWSFSNDMFILYRFFYKLRKAGCKNAYIIWEMGSHGVQESAIAFRNIVRELEKDTDPAKLPDEFFGIDKTFEAQQMTAIREHAWDPLEGMLMIPEQKHTFLSRRALDQGKAREWEKEKYR